MNAVGLVQSKWLPNFAQGPLRSYFDEQQKKWNSSLIAILCFYIVFVHYLWYFDFNLAYKRGEEKF